MSEIFTVNMPDIGEGVVEGEVITWIKNENDPVAQDEPVVVLMTDKATVELPAPYPGTVVKQYYQPGEIAIKGKPLYDIEVREGITTTKKEQPAKGAESKRQSQRPEKETTLPKTKGSTEKMTRLAKAGSVLATPAVRHLAKSVGIDLSEVQGSGKEGRITIEDLKSYQTKGARKGSQLPPPIFPQDEIIPLSGVRGLMAKKMQVSHANIPHFSYFEQVDASRLITLKTKFKTEGIKEGVNVTFMPFFIKALSLTIHKFPEINSSVDMEEGKLILHKEHNIGIATKTPSGLIVPVIKNVENMSIEMIVRSFADLKQRTISKGLTPSDMKHGTITISNFGTLSDGGLWATPIINFPETAILAIAKIQKQPVAKQGSLTVTDVAHLSWSFDHRVIDGDLAANCSYFFSQLINNPAALL